MRCKSPHPTHFHGHLESAEQKEKQALSWNENLQVKERQLLQFKKLLSICAIHSTLSNMHQKRIVNTSWFRYIWKETDALLFFSLRLFLSQDELLVCYHLECSLQFMLTYFFSYSLHSISFSYLHILSKRSKILTKKSHKRTFFSVKA